MCRSKSVQNPSHASLAWSSNQIPQIHQKCPLQTSEISDWCQLDRAKQKNNCADPVSFATLGNLQSKDLDKWTSDEVASWLLAIGLVTCAAKVRSHDIAGDVAGDVTFADAAEMGLREIDCYRLVRALGELQNLADEVWQRPNQLSDRLKQDSLEHHRMKLSQTNESEVIHENKRCKQYSPEKHQVRFKTEAHCTEAKITQAYVTQTPVSPSMPMVLPIKKRVQFNDEVEQIAW